MSFSFTYSWTFTPTPCLLKNSIRAQIIIHLNFTITPFGIHFLSFHRFQCSYIFGEFSDRNFSMSGHDTFWYGIMQEDILSLKFAPCYSSAGEDGTPDWMDPHTSLLELSAAQCPELLKSSCSATPALRKWVKLK